MNTIVLSIDGLHHGYLGCYGNGWINTPETDRLAADSCVYDAYWLDSPDPQRVLTSCWTGQHAFFEGSPTEGMSLASLLAEAGVTGTLLSDLPHTASHPLAGSFDDLIQLDTPRASQNAASIDRTQLARLFAAATDWLSDAPAKPFLLWVQAEGMAGAWDAPLEFRERFVDDPDEASPPSDVDFPPQHLPDDFDPDELLGWRRAYAGQVELFDLCLGGLLESLDQLALRDKTLLVLVSSRGFPLGEHGRLGHVDQALFGELLHVPLMIRLPDVREGGGTRSGALVQPPDLCAALTEWHGLSPAHATQQASSLLALARGEDDDWRKVALTAGGAGERMLHTPAWYLRTQDAVEAPLATSQLYRKPDDRWEVNDVSDRCQSIVTQMRDVLKQATESGGAAPERWPTLSEELIEGLD